MSKFRSTRSRPRRHGRKRPEGALSHFLGAGGKRARPVGRNAEGDGLWMQRHRGRFGGLAGAHHDQQRSNAMTRISILERLKEIQKMPRYQGRDITTISAVL